MRVIWMGDSLGGNTLSSLKGLPRTNLNDNTILVRITHLRPWGFMCRLKCSIIIGVGTHNHIVDLATLLPFVNHFTQCNDLQFYVRNYIEPSNCIITDGSCSSCLSYAYLGDTHHIKNSLPFAFECLLRIKPHVVMSRSNPLHMNGLIANLRAHIENLQICCSAAPDYLLFFSSLSDVIDSSVEDKHYFWSMCVSGLSVQSGRRKLLKLIMKNKFDLGSGLFYPFISEESIYRNILRLSLHSLIPSINGQISPQIFYALSCGNRPVVDCANALKAYDFGLRTLDLCDSRGLYFYCRDYCKTTLIRSLSSHSSPGLRKSYFDLINRLIFVAADEVEYVSKFKSGDPLLTTQFTVGNAPYPSDQIVFKQPFKSLAFISNYYCFLQSSNSLTPPSFYDFMRRNGDDFEDVDPGLFLHQLMHR